MFKKGRIRVTLSNGKAGGPGKVKGALVFRAQVVQDRNIRLTVLRPFGIQKCCRKDVKVLFTPPWNVHKWWKSTSSWVIWLILGTSMGQSAETVTAAFSNRPRQ